MKLIREHINEKFQEESDPIDDMGIGMMAFWEKMFKQKGNQSSVEGSLLYFRDEDHDKESYLIYKILKFIVQNRVTNMKSIKRKLDEYIYYDTFEKVDRKALLKVLKKHFYIDVENINEKFQEDSDPITDMGIGAYKNIEHCVEHIFDIDTKNITIHDYPAGCINKIYIYNKKFIIRYFSNRFIEGNTDQEKLKIQKKYFIDLLKQVGIYDFLELVDEYDKKYRLIFKINKDVVKYFSDGTYDEYDYKRGDHNYKKPYDKIYDS
jgi:hypothetical protein